MPILKGYLRCKCCDSVAEVMEAEGKRVGRLYIRCPECGTDQSHSPKRQEFIKKYMAATPEELAEPVAFEPVVNKSSEVVENEPEQSSEPEDEKGVSGWAVFGAIALTAIGLGAIAHKVA